jgi:hypothetical protein
MIRRMLLVGALFLVLSGLNAQTLKIQGTVTDQQRKAPLQGATVRLKGSSDSTLLRTQLSDSTGGFMFSSLLPGSFELSVSFTGFNEVTSAGLIPGAGYRDHYFYSACCCAKRRYTADQRRPVQGKS